MGFLHNLWDETLAGPAPENGHGKLRKYNSLSAARSEPDGNDVVQAPISRSITILRNGSNPPLRKLKVAVDPSGYTDESPTGSTSPLSPFSPGTPSGNTRRGNRRKLSGEAMARAEPTSPNDFDRIFLSALDR